MKRKFQALHRYVVVEKIKEAKVVGGLKVVEAYDSDRFIFSKVVSVGSLVEGIEVGDEVYFDKSSGKQLTFDNQQYFVLQDQHIVITACLS